MSGNNLITVILNPFGQDRSRVIAYADYKGKTVQEVIEKYWVSKAYGCIPSINGEIINDLNTIIKEGENVVLCPIVAGGGGGKNVLRSIALVAVMVAATVVTSGGALALSGALVAGSTAAAFWGATIAVGGSLLVNSLMPVQTADLGPATGIDTSDTYGWDLPANRVQEGLVLPVVYGTSLIYPNVISRYTSIDNAKNEQTLNLLYGVCEGNVSSIGSVIINDSPVASYPDVTTETRLGTTAQTVIDAFMDIRSDQNVNLELIDNDYSATQTTVGSDLKSIGIGLLFPIGLGTYDDQSNLNSLSVTIRFEYKLSSSGTWSEINEVIADKTQSPKKYFYSIGSLSAGTYDVRVKVFSDRHTGAKDLERIVFSHLQESENDDFNYPDTALLSVKALATDLLQGTAPVVSCIVTKQYISVKTPGAAYNDIPLTSIGISGTANVSTVINVSSALTLDVGMVGKYLDLQFDDMRADVANLAGRYLILAVDNTARTITVEWNTGLVGLGGSGAGMMTGSILDNVAGNNPAWCCYDLITNPSYGAGVDVDRMDYAQFLAWATFCSDNSYECNLTIDMDLTLSNALNMMSTLGHGSIVQRGTEFSCIYDGQSSMVQMFTVGNIEENTFNETYISRENRANIIEVTYWDKERDYERTTMEVSSTDYDENIQKEQRTNISLPGCTDKTMAAKYCRFLLNCNKYLSRSISFEASSDCIACSIGDVVGVQHDVPQWGLAGGRVVSATTTQIVLDTPVPCSVGVNYSIIVRKSSDDTFQERALANPGNGSFTTFTLASGTWTYTPSADDLYSMGIENLVVKLYRITSLNRGQDLNCKVEAMEYRSEVYSDTETIPDYPLDSYLPQVDGVRVDDSFPMDANGIRHGAINVNWRGFALSWNVYYREYNVGANWIFSKTVYDTKHTIEPVDIGKTYEVCVSVGDPADGETDTILIQIDGPGAPTNLYAEVLDNNVLLKWTANPDDLPIEKFIVKRGSFYDNASEIGYSKTTFKSVFEQVSGTYTYHVAAVDTAGNVSPSASVTVTVDVPVDYKADLRKAIVDHTSRSLTNLVEVSTDAIVGPVSLTETWEDWWDNNGYGSGTFQDFIDDGYITYITPDATTTAKYESGVVDFGAVYSNATFAVDIAYDVIEGSDPQSVMPTMYSSPDNVTWTTHSSVNRIYVTGVRYIKFDIDFTIPAGTKIKLTKADIVNVTKKVKSNGSDSITVAATGKVVSITASYAYADVDTIIATPRGTSALTAVIDFTDVPNPTEFTVYLFDSAGNKTTGDVYYEIIGV